MQPQTGAPAPATPPMGQPPMGQVPMQPMQPMTPQKKWFNNKFSKWLFVALFAVVGGLATYLIFAQTNNGTQYFWDSQRYEETYWDGQVHTNPTECATRGFICHENGTLVFTGGQDRVWQSDPKKNNDKKLTHATWHGPYDYSSGPYNGYGFGVTGSQQVCFMMKDTTKGNDAARITLRVQNLIFNNKGQKGSSTGQVQNLVTLEGTLSKSFKKNFIPVCLSYFNPKDAYAQQYMVYVKKGTVQIDYVDHLTQYFTYDYNPYPYDYFSKAVTANSTNNSKQTNAICSAKLSKSTAHCLSASDLSNASANNQLTDIQLNPPDQD
jgi:hypothetical protein